MKIKSIIALVFLWISTIAMAQETKPVSLQFEARADYQRTDIDGKHIKNESGFKGYIVNIILKGDISPKFSYAFRNRLNGINKDYNFFNSTDWLYLKYKPNKNVAIIAGKYIVLVAGYELLPAPIDCYFLSEFCYNFPCYQWGVVGELATNSGNDVFSAQICQSPYQKVYENKAGKAAEMYAYNVLWNGRHGIWETFWSVNMSEYAPHKFINYISLGNKFHFTNNLQLELDYWNRAATEKLNVFAKASYEVNHAGTEADVALHDGTELTRVGAGVEYYPLKDKNVRIHGYYSYAFGKNANPEGVVQDKMSQFNVGVTWRGKVL